MLKVAICDDQVLELKLLELHLEQYQRLRERTFSVETFSSSPELVRRLMAGGQYDLLILDMVMPEYSGVDVGHIVRGLGLESAILFHTVSASFALDAIAVHPVEYLLKPLNAARLYAALDTAFACMESRNAGLTLQTRLGTESLSWEEIVCVEHAGRIARVHTADGGVRESVYLRASFQSLVAPLLRRVDFVQTHKSFLANLLHVRALRGTALLTATGVEVPISRRSAAETRQRYLRYWQQGWPGPPDS